MKLSYLVKIGSKDAFLVSADHGSWSIKLKSLV